MTMDGLTLTCALCEIRELVGGKIDKVTQPERDEIVLNVRKDSHSSMILLCSSPENCRVHVTSIKKENPSDAPGFCMILRKKICGGKIIAVSQPSSDRIARIEIENTNEMYDKAKFSLVVEVMGRHSNIVLVDSSGTIADSIRHIGPGISSQRSVMPGLLYEEPPTKHKADPTIAVEADFYSALGTGIRADKAISDAFYGISPKVATALAESFGVDISSRELSEGDRLYLSAQFYRFYKEKVCVSNFCPTVVADERGVPISIYPFVPNIPERFCIRFDRISDALDYLYAKADKKTHIERCSQGLTHSVNLQIERRRNKLSIFEEAIASVEKAETFRVMGDLITANLYLLKQGMSSAVVMDYYADPPREVTIELDPRYSPSVNAGIFYKKYQKAKSAREKALSMRNGILDELEYLNTQLVNLSNASTADEVEEIRTELCDLGYVKRDRTIKKKKKTQTSLPHKFVSVDGFEILVGKNNRQNDQLTLKTAAPSDIWLHVQNMPGAHTIILMCGKTELPNTTLLEAAKYAASFSSAKNSENVPVDYTLRKYVKKPSGALPGKVIYTNQKTVFVTPN